MDNEFDYAQDHSCRNKPTCYEITTTQYFKEEVENINEKKYAVIHFLNMSFNQLIVSD